MHEIWRNKIHLWRRFPFLSHPGNPQGFKPQRRSPTTTTLGIPRSTIYEQQRGTLFPSLSLSLSLPFFLALSLARACASFEVFLPPSLPRSRVCGIVCHSQALAKYARPFVSDLLFWHPLFYTRRKQN